MGAPGAKPEDPWRLDNLSAAIGGALGAALGGVLGFLLRGSRDKDEDE